MLPADARMRSAAEFREATRRGPRCLRRTTPTLVVHLMLAEPSSPPSALPRVGFVVSKAVGTAVVRNRVRRRLRALIAARLAQLSGPSGAAAVVVRVLPAAASASSHQLSVDLDHAFTRLLLPPLSAARS